MGLPVRQRRVLERIEIALQGSDPKLAALFATFARLTQDEEMPRIEQMRHRVMLTLAGLRLRLRRPPVQAAHPPSAAAARSALLPAGDRADGDVDRLRSPIEQQHVHAGQVSSGREDRAQRQHDRAQPEALQAASHGTVCRPLT